MRHTTFYSFILVSFFLARNTFSQSSLDLIRTHIKEHARDFHVLPSDVADLEIVSEAPSKAEGVRHFYVRQRVNGIAVSNGLATVTIKDDKVIHIASRLKSNLPALPEHPILTAASAITSVASQLGIVHTSDPNLLVSEAKAQEYLFGKADISLEDIPVKLVYTVDKSGAWILSWDLSIASLNKQNWWSVRVSATDGTIIERNDWIKQCNFDHCPESDEHYATAHKKMIPLLPPPPPPGADQYNVYALPIESPSFGNLSVVVDPSDPIASPYGWHDTNGAAGDEYTITRGNNVYASEDANDDDLPGYSPDGTSTLNFNFNYDQALGVQQNLDVVITNLFYMNNMMHDIWNHYGFDEASGNFQEMNYSGDGLGQDHVLADAQDGSGLNNANFGTPPEGTNPRMQMFLFSDADPADILTVNSPSTLAQSYNAAASGFGPPIPTTPLTEDLVLVDDGTGDATDGCQTILNGAAINGKIALVRRGTCSLASKVEACEASGAIAVIVMNNSGGQPFPMTGSSSSTVPSLMISQAAGNTFVGAINNGEVINTTIVSTVDPSMRDSDFDNFVIAHEYGHGISTRLTGGGENSDCLVNFEQMGEGWSDWFALMVTMEPGDQGTDSRTVSTYLMNEPITGPGIRPAPYSTDLTVNPFTYGDLGNSPTTSETHGVGFIWATMLWDLTWALVDEYGFDPNLKTGTGGNNKAMALVIEGLKIQPCHPGFIDGRNAILSADEILFGGVNKCLIWEVFARRGLGLNALQGSTDSVEDQTESFDLLPACDPNLGLDQNELDRISIYPNPAKDLLNIDMSGYNNVTTIRVTDLQGKVLFETTDITSSKVTIDLSAWKSGLYMIQLTDRNGARAVEIIKH